MRISRPCYDKPHRCPGRAGGGMKWAKVQRCESGMLSAPYARRYWLGTRCRECGVIVLPIAVEWLDWHWVWYRLRNPRRPMWTYWLSPRYVRLRWRKPMSEMTPAWADLLEGLQILSRHPTNDISPLHCDPEMLVVMSDVNGFTEEELAHLDSLGFHYNDVHGFYSFRFGSA